MNFPAELHYTKDHEWIRLEGNVATIGITDFAQHELGDIVYVDINAIGKPLSAEEIFGTVEAVKTVSDLFLPVTGTVTVVNPLLEKQPELVNTDPYGYFEGGGLLLKTCDASHLGDLDTWRVIFERCRSDRS